MFSRPLEGSSSFIGQDLAHPSIHLKGSLCCLVSFGLRYALTSLSKMSSLSCGLLVSVLVVLVVGTQAIFGRGNPTATSDGRAVEQECLSQAEAGSCEFYSCFERRLPCGRNWYMMRHGLYYCNKMRRLQNTFTSTGQTFLDDAQRCMTQALASTYQLDYINCHTLEHTAVDAITQCFQDHAFCNVFTDNSGRFFDIFEFGDLFTRGAGKIWRAISTLGATCATDAIRDVSSDAGETIISAFNSLFGRDRK